MAEIAYLKMNGLGNDFVVLDGRETKIDLSEDQVRWLADREQGLGCDQVIVLGATDSDQADVFMRIFNAEGGEVDACGNATRCVAALVAEELTRDQINIQTHAGLLIASVAGDQVTVDMGRPKFGWQDIPLSEEFADTTGIELQIGPIDDPVLHTPSVVNVGNPHAIFWIDDDPDSFDLERFGPLLENHPLFPERANISLAQVQENDRIKVRVWERGVGLTLACGTAACAVGAAAPRKGLTSRDTTIALPGGDLRISWREADDHILMTGPWSLDDRGTLPQDFMTLGAA